MEYRSCSFINHINNNQKGQNHEANVRIAACCPVAGACGPAFSQSGRIGLGGGVGCGGTLGITDSEDKTSRFQARGFLRYGFIDQLELELGGGVGKIAGADYQTLMFPIDLRLVFSPFQLEDINPFVYAGVGALYYKLERPQTPFTQTLTEWTGYAPVGAGIQFQLQDRIALELSGGYGFTLSDKLNGIEVPEQKDTRTIKKDAFFGFLLGLTVTGGESGSADPDNDGLTNNEEKQLGTDPHNADTDGDGLSDGDEVNKYRTAPLKADSDGDGLKDGEEATKYKTDPNKADTDGDGLNDGDEIKKYGTDALKADTDGDGLNDGQEVTTYKTDPLKSDTDGDGLNDSAEVLRHKTDPLKKDTDGGTVNDGDEIARRSDPLNPSDDVPKKEEIKVEVGKAIVLEGIVFKTASAEITPESERNLEKALTGC